MRRCAILILLAGLIGWSGQAHATRITPPTRCQGDPDEFQAKQVPDGGALMLGSDFHRDWTCRRAGGEHKGPAATPARGTRPATQAKVSITLGGHTFLWDK
ncbi:MAG TPA: hypothetical protein VMU02_05050 [bacterium]|nr:hypothetical protein [bacterium]